MNATQNTTAAKVMKAAWAAYRNQAVRTRAAFAACLKKMWLQAKAGCGFDITNREGLAEAMASYRQADNSFSELSAKYSDAKDFMRANFNSEDEMSDEYKAGFLDLFRSYKAAKAKAEDMYNEYKNNQYWGNIFLRELRRNY